MILQWLLNVGQLSGSQPKFGILDYNKFSSCREDGGKFFSSRFRVAFCLIAAPLPQPAKICPYGKQQWGLQPQQRPEWSAGTLWFFWSRPFRVQYGSAYPQGEVQDLGSRGGMMQRWNDGDYSGSMRGKADGSWRFEGTSESGIGKHAGSNSEPLGDVFFLIHVDQSKAEEAGWLEIMAWVSMVGGMWSKVDINKSAWRLGEASALLWIPTQELRLDVMQAESQRFLSTFQKTGMQLIDRPSWQWRWAVCSRVWTVAAWQWSLHQRLDSHRETSYREGSTHWSAGFCVRFVLGSWGYVQLCSQLFEFFSDWVSVWAWRISRTNFNPTALLHPSPTAFMFCWMCTRPHLHIAAV